MSQLLRSWCCVICGRRKIASGGADTAPPRSFPPEGWCEVGPYDFCEKHRSEGDSFERELEFWYVLRSAWERENPRPQPPETPSNGAH